MHYNVTIVKDEASNETLFINACRAAVEHLLQMFLIGPQISMRVIADGVLCAAEAFPLDMHKTADAYRVNLTRLAEAIDIDAAMQAQHVDDRLDWQKQEDEDFAQAEAETDHRRGFEWMNKP